MAIEDVAKEKPEWIFKIHVNLKEGLTDAILKDVAKNLEMEHK
jgi:succinyl-CoA synthetase beta subunit